MKKYIVRTAAAFVFLTAAVPGITAQTAESVPDHKPSFFFTMGPLAIINTESSTKSAPTPIVFSTGFGMKFLEDKMVAFEPRVSFFTNYYLWDGDNALPAEVENRTAIALSLLFDLPAVVTFHHGENTFEAGSGLGFLARYGILANGVSSSDTGASGSASGDVDKINDWFWSGARYVFPELLGSWTYAVSSRLQAGFEGRVYFPLGSLMNGRGFDAMMFSLAARIQFK